MITRFEFFRIGGVIAVMLSLVGGCGGPEISHAEEIQPIWDDNCVKDDCHGRDSKWNTPDLSDDAHPDIVGVVATQPLLQSVEMDYVEPGNVENSYLFHKIRGTHDGTPMGKGEQMPCDQVEDDLTCAGNSMSLAEEDVETIRSWIESGAAK